MQPKLEWITPVPFYAYKEFKWSVFNNEQSKMNQIVPMYYSLPKGMFSKFLVDYLNWIKKNGSYEELIALSQASFGEDYPDWLYYELSIINPHEPINYFTYINIFTKALTDAYKTYDYVHSSKDVVTALDAIRKELKTKLLSLYNSIDSLSDTDIKDLQNCFSRFVS